MVEFDASARAAAKCTRMWNRLGKMYENLAVHNIERGFGQIAFADAKRADVCYWMATGELDSLTIKDIDGEAKNA